MLCKSILIIDDNFDICDTLKMFLELEDYTVYTAQNGKEGLEMLPKCEAPTLILLDLMMPVMNGFVFLEKIKESPEYSKYPIIIISAFHKEAQTIRTEAFLPKPFEFKRLLEYTARFCEKHA